MQIAKIVEANWKQSSPEQVKLSLKCTVKLQTVSCFGNNSKEIQTKLLDKYMNLYPKMGSETSDSYYWIGVMIL